MQQHAAMPEEPWLSERDSLLILHVPMQFRRRGGRKEILPPPNGNGREPRTSPVYKPLAVAVARAHRWEELLEQGRFSSINELADAVGVDRGYVGRLLNLTLLAPDIVEMILDGREPSGLSLRQLNRIMPLQWNEQRRVAASFSNGD